jgi:23S rRNA (uracil1939-C5)-methyltransferase
VFVADTVPGDRVRVRLIQVKPSYAHAQLEQVLASGQERVRPACIVADKCGGCQWQTVDYALQLQSKQNQVKDTLERLGQFLEPVVNEILPAPSPLGYRNKVTYPLRESNGQVQAGYYRKGSHRLINLNQCPVQDPRLNPLLAEVKQDLQARRWPIYIEETHQGNLRHLSLRIGRHTGEILLTLIGCNAHLPGLKEQADDWLKRYPELAGVCFNHNPHQGNRIFGAQTDCIAGRDYLTERLAGLEFQICADTFFQIYTEQAEAFIQLLLAGLNLQGQEKIVDAYCGIGTLTLPLARHCQQILGIEMHPGTVAQARTNAAINQITNAEFEAGAVEIVLPQLAWQPDVVVLDPPRKGCEAEVLKCLKTLAPTRIVYMSCNPTTLARDLKILCQSGIYELQKVQPGDFFPQTAHVESLAWLQRHS